MQQQQQYRWRSAFLALFFLFIWCRVEAGEIITPPHGFWIASKEEKGQLYGPTSGNADWNISQWHAPKGELEGFKGGVAKGPNQNVRVLDGSYEIESDGNGLACGQEYGAFAGANNPRVHKRYPSAYRESPPLSAMRRLKHRIALTPLAELVRDRNCQVTRGVIMTAVVLRNTHTDATFFYQLRLRKVNRAPEPHWWWKGERGGGKGKNFGFGDNLETFGMGDAQLNRRTIVEVDLLPRLKELLRDPQVNIDRDPSHWVVSGTYHGQGIYGNIKILTRWDSFSLSYE